MIITRPRKSRRWVVCTGLCRPRERSPAPVLFRPVDVTIPHGPALRVQPSERLCFEAQGARQGGAHADGRDRGVAQYRLGQQPVEAIHAVKEDSRLRKVPDLIPDLEGACVGPAAKMQGELDGRLRLAETDLQVAAVLPTLPDGNAGIIRPPWRQSMCPPSGVEFSKEWMS